MNLPIASHLSKTTVAPKFSNKKEDWHDFVRKYESWARNMASGQTSSDAQQLQMFNSCLPESLQKELQLLEREKGLVPTYVEFRACLEAKFGRAQSECMRKRRMDVQLPQNSGKADPELLMNFGSISNWHGLMFPMLPRMRPGDFCWKNYIHSCAHGWWTQRPKKCGQGLLWN